MKTQHVNLVQLIAGKQGVVKTAIFGAFNRKTILVTESDKKQSAFQLETIANELLTAAKKIREAI